MRVVSRAVRPVAFAAAVTAAIALTGALTGPAVRLTAADGVEVAPGVSVTPAPGWSVGNQGPGWVLLHNVFSSAEMEVRVKPATGTDPVAVLQDDINNLGATVTGLSNVKDLSAPIATTVAGANFQKKAFIDYTADGASQLGAIPVIGAFIELLNPSTHQSAFIVFTQNGDATTHVDADGGAMIDSML